MLGPDELKPGNTLGKYEIVRKLAVGGMAQIYLARARGTAGFEKLVVLKRILPSVAEDHGFVQMFLDEARLAAALRHPNIADVFDVGTESDSYYFAMEFIHGQDVRTIRLAAYEANRDIPLEVALAIISGTAYALSYAHAYAGLTGPLGIVHRDVSPSNILVSYDGAVKLVDFGIARADSRSGTVKTRTGTLRGKVPYMSPEQCRGKKLDRRSDLFSLGSVLYELTTGRRPFEGHSEYDTLEMIVLGELAPPSVHVASYPPELEAIVLRLLSVEPAERYQTADDLLVDLEQLMSRSQLIASERIVARYMRELFAEEITESETAPGSTLYAAATLRPPSHYRTELATGSHELRARKQAPTTPFKISPKLALDLEPDDLDIPAEQPTVEHRIDPADLEEPMSPLLVTPDVQVFVRPRRGGPSPEPSSPFDDAPTQQRARLDQLRAFAPEETRADAVLRFDPVVARAAEVLDDIERGVPADAPATDRAVLRVNALIARAGRWLAIGELEKAVMAAELALREDAGDERVVLALVRGQPVLAGVFEAYLGDRDRPLVLGRPLSELAELRLDQRAAFLLSRVDGSLTIDQLLDTAAIPRFEACRSLCRLALRKMIVPG